VSPREVHLELLLGRPVLAANGRSIGRIEEVRAEKHGTGYVVSEYHIGPAALLERLSLTLRLPWAARGYVASWDQLDVSDAERIRLTCDVAQLRRV
jgi:hypothetical protein